MTLAWAPGECEHRNCQRGNPASALGKMSLVYHARHAHASMGGLSQLVVVCWAIGTGPPVGKLMVDGAAAMCSRQP